MRNWHDFHITGYTVDGARQQLRFDLQWPYETLADCKRARILFGAVEAYFLEHDLGANIVYDLVERPLRPFLEEWAERFELSSQFGWPKFWRQQAYPRRPAAVELEEAYQWLTDRGTKPIELSSSYGLNGWILAGSVREEIDLE